MAEFQYRAADRRGQLVEGLIESASQDAAQRELRTRGLLPVSLVLAGNGASGADLGSAQRGRRLGRGGRVGAQQVQRLTNELSVMLRAGLPLDRALRILKGMSQGDPALPVIEDLLAAVKSGKSLSQALQPHQALFGDFYLSMVRSGELGGQLAEILGRLAEHLERVKALRDAIVSALIYPAILLVVALLSVVFMLGFVVPQFETLFDDMGEALPLPTRIIVGAGHLVADWWLPGILLFALLVWAVRNWLRTTDGRTWLDQRLLALPLFGPLLTKYEITRFSRSMGTLLNCGVPIVQSFRIAYDTVGNRVLRTRLDAVPATLKQGGRLADALGSADIMTPLAINMVRLGEETGRLDAMLLELARIHDAEVQAGIKRGLTLLEPLLILGLGGLVAAIIVSILMGILSVNELIA